MTKQTTDTPTTPPTAADAPQRDGLTTQLTPEEWKLVESMRTASDKYCPFTKQDMDEMIAIIDRLDRAYDALRRGYYPGELPTPAATPAPQAEAVASFAVGQRVKHLNGDTATVNAAIDDDRLLVTRDSDGKQRIWSPRNVNILQTHPAADTPAPSPDAQRVAPKHVSTIQIEAALLTGRQREALRLASTGHGVWNKHKDNRGKSNVVALQILRKLEALGLVEPRNTGDTRWSVQYFTTEKGNQILRTLTR